MRYLSVAETAKKWDISERSVRNYCAHGRVPGHFLQERPGMYRKMQVSRYEQIRRRISRKLYFPFCRKKRKVNIPVESIIRHRLI